MLAISAKIELAPKDARSLCSRCTENYRSNP